MSDPDHDHEPPPASVKENNDEKPGLPPRPPSVMPLQGLLETVHASLIDRIRDSSDRGMEHLLARYFPLDPQTGRMTPKTVQVPLPGPNGTPILRDVPLFLLANHHDVAVDSFVIKMKTGLLERTGPDGASQLLVDLDAGNNGHEASTEIEIRFRGTGAAHGIARINDTIVKQIGGEEG